MAKLLGWWYATGAFKHYRVVSEPPRCGVVRIRMDESGEEFWCQRVWVERNARPPMSPDEFCAARDVVGWSTAKLADEINVDLRTVRRWISGEMPIPPRIAEWLTELAAEHVARPVPGA